MCVPNVFVCCTSGALLPVLLRIRTTPPFVHGSLWLLSSPQQAFTCQASGFVISLFVFHRADSTTQFVPPSLPVDSPPPLLHTGTVICLKSPRRQGKVVVERSNLGPHAMGRRAISGDCPMGPGGLHFMQTSLTCQRPCMYSFTLIHLDIVRPAI